MKKLIIILYFLISVTAYSQGVKISAMPTWTTSLDSVWFPIINFNGTNWVNYRAQGWQIAKERIDSVVTALDGKVNATTTITINGVTFDLSDNRSWTVSGGTAVKANNGLVINSGTADTVQLGSSTAGPAVLLTNRFIDFSSKYLSLTGTVADGFGMIRIANTNGGFALTASSSSDVIQASSTAGAAGSFISTSGTPITAATTSGAYGMDLSVNPTSTNTVKSVVLMSRNSSGTPAVGMGNALEYSMERSNASGISTTKIASVWSDPASASYTANVEIYTADNATLPKQFTLYGANGNIELHQLNAGVILSSPDGTRYILTIANGGTVNVAAAP